MRLLGPLSLVPCGVVGLFIGGKRRGQEVPSIITFSITAPRTTTLTMFLASAARNLDKHVDGSRRRCPYVIVTFSERWNFGPRTSTRSSGALHSPCPSCLLDRGRYCKSFIEDGSIREQPCPTPFGGPNRIACIFYRTASGIDAALCMDGIMLGYVQGAHAYHSSHSLA